LSRPWVRITNDSLHDLAAGAWPGAVIALWIAHVGAANYAAAGAAVPSPRAWLGIYAILVGVLVVQAATGLVRLRLRTLRMRDEAAAPPKSSSVVLAKHAVFAVVLIVATIGAVVLLPL
jgi:putative copper export protein